MTSDKDRKAARDLMTIAAGMPPGKERDAKIREAEIISRRIIQKDADSTAPD